MNSKKTFANTPAANFISTVGDDDKQNCQNSSFETPRGTGSHSPQADVPEGYKIDPRFVEKKSRRVQLLFKPSVYDAAKRIAAENGKSVNDYIHSIIEKEVKGE